MYFGVRRLTVARFKTHGVSSDTEAAVLESGGKPPHSKPELRSTSRDHQSPIAVCGSRPADQFGSDTYLSRSPGPLALGDDRLATLRDPWGVAIQFVVRKERMV